MNASEEVTWSDPTLSGESVVLGVGDVVRILVQGQIPEDATVLPARNDFPSIKLNVLKDVQPDLDYYHEAGRQIAEQLEQRFVDELFNDDTKE